ncbi:MAG: MFS transporter [Alphaproteobacteria bacterium]|nr:MFS transporter [Alphaproteobacteria bacterium]
MPQQNEATFSILQFYLTLFSIGTLVMLLNIEFSAVNLALVPISKDIDVNLNDLQWVLSSYILVWAALVVPAGRLADLYGKKLMLIIGILTFMIGSFVSGIANHIGPLIMGRIIQGIGAAILSAPAYGIIFSSAPARLQGTAMGIVAGIAGFGLAIGPSLAGYIIKDFSWRWIFYINVPLGVLVITAIFYLVPKSQNAKSHGKMNYGTSLLLILGLAGFVFGLNQIEVWGYKHSLLWIILIGSLCLLGIFYKLDQRSVHQTLPKSLLHHKTYRATLITMMSLAYIFALTLFMVSLYLQSTLRLSAYEAGIALMFFSASYGILSPIGGKITDKFGIQIPCAIGVLCLAAGLSLLGFSSEKSTLLFLSFPLLLLGIGLGVTFPAINTAMFKTVPPALMNTGSALFTMVMMLGNTISVIASSSLLVFWSDFKLKGLLEKANITLTPEHYDILLKVISKAEHTKDQLQGFNEKEIPTLLSIIDQAFVKGFHLNMWIGVFMAFVALYYIMRYFSANAFQNQTSAPVMPIH